MSILESVLTLSLKEKRADLDVVADNAFMRGFGVALASIWHCQHDGQLVRMLLKTNGLTLEEFQGIGLMDSDYEAICRAAGTSEGTYR